MFLSLCFDIFGLNSLYLSRLASFYRLNLLTCAEETLIELAQERTVSTVSSHLVCTEQFQQQPQLQHSPFTF